MMDFLLWTSERPMAVNSLHKAEPNLKKNKLAKKRASLDLVDSQGHSGKHKYECHAESEHPSQHNTCCQKLREDREKLRHERESVRREKQVLRANRELLQAEKKVLEADKEIVKADREALQAEKEALKAQKHMLKCERDALKADRCALEAERKELEAERITLKAQLAVLKAERFSLESERALLVSELATDQKRIKGSSVAEGRCDFNDDYDGDGGSEAEDSGEDGMTDLCVQFGEPSSSLGDASEESKAHKEMNDFYQCDICSKMYRSYKSFKRHLKIHSSGFYCGACQKPFSSKEELSKHKLEHAKSKLICPVCGDALVSKYSLEKHRKMKHAKEELLACTYPGCTKRFFNEQLLSDHTNVHTQKKPYHCLKCGRQYASALALIAHKKGCGNPDAHVCDICGVRMSARSTLAEHKRRRHTDERFTCACGQRYAWRSGIIRHKKKCQAAVLD